MINFIKNNWDKCLSIIGAAAWVPIIFAPIIKHFEKINVTLLDSRILSNGEGVSAYKKEKKNGTILMLALNFFKPTTIFAKKIIVTTFLKSGAKLNSEILDFSTLESNNDNNTTSTFYVPEEQEFNISRTIHGGVDNIKYLAVLVENGTFNSMTDIQKICIKIYYRENNCNFFAKSIYITQDDFPKFNSAKMISRIERIHK